MELRDWIHYYTEAGGFAEHDLPRRSCATVGINHLLMEQNPPFRLLSSELERETRARLAEPAAFAAEEVVTIPVVVHILWHVENENISDAQVMSQIDALNRDYSGQNADIDQTPTVWRGLAGDTGIRFRLAELDEDGNPHPGITRTRTDRASFRANDDMKMPEWGGVAGWPADRYLNIWVCNLERILGYAQFPGGPPATDGIVIGHPYFGRTGTATEPFNGGRTATHEVGHWLNLRHIWGDTEDCSGSDFVDDTPHQRLPNYGVPEFPTVSCSNGPHGDMFMNYMDYVDDAAMVMFTAGQVVRMQTALHTIRMALLTSSPFGS